MTDPATTEAGSTRAFITVGIGLVVPALPAFMVGALGTQVRAELGLTESALGLIVAVLFVVSALAGPLTGRLADRLGDRFAITAGTVLSFLALMGIGIAAQRWSDLVLLMICGGIGIALVDPGLARMVAGRVPERWRGLVFGVKESSIPLATMVAGFAVPLIAVTVGWRWAVTVAVVPFVAVMALLFGRRSPRRRGNGPAADPAPGAASASDPAPAPDTPTTSRRSRTLPPGVVWLAVGAALGTAAATGVSVFLTQTAVVTGLTVGQGGVLLGVASLVGVATRIGTGVLAGRRPSAELRLMPWMLAVGAITMVFAATGTPLGLVVGSFGTFAGGWGWTALFFLALVRSAPARPGAVAGVGLSGLGVGNATGPIVFGLVAQTVSFQAAWLFAASAAALAAVAMHRAGRLLAGARPG